MTIYKMKVILRKEVRVMFMDKNKFRTNVNTVSKANHIYSELPPQIEDQVGI